MKFLYKPITNKKQIGRRRNHSDIKYLVIHDTGNTSRAADAMAHFRYLQNATRYGSAHYYLDDKEIIQTIGDSLVAWSIGDKWGYGNNPNRIKDAYNSNSISIELCINSDIDQAKAYKNLVELTKNLMAKFKIPPERVIRHFDATGKSCPNSWSKNNWSKWWQFKEDIKKPIEWKIDLSKDSEFGTSTNDFIGQVAVALKGQKLNILPSVTIAQAILESNWGKSSLAVEANNLFGIKASKDWTGGVYIKTTKEQKPNGNIYTINANFRKYASWNESIKDHDNFFVSTPWRTQNYQKVLTAKNYKDQAQALRECGYATDLNYGSKLIRLIEQHNLQKYDEGVKLMTKDNSKPSDWAKDDWDWGKEKGITDGTNPVDICTREQVVAMIRRYDSLKEK